MDLNAMKERFSFAYVEAVASQAGYWIADPRVDRRSVDGILMGDTVGLPRLDFQLKATSQDVVRGEHLHFPLPIGNYNDLRLQARAARILIVLQLPENVEEWINQSRDEMCQRYCAYWLSLRGCFQSLRLALDLTYETQTIPQRPYRPRVGHSASLTPASQAWRTATHSRYT